LIREGLRLRTPGGDFLPQSAISLGMVGCPVGRDPPAAIVEVIIEDWSSAVVYAPALPLRQHTLHPSR